MNEYVVTFNTGDKVVYAADSRDEVREILTLEGVTVVSEVRSIRQYWPGEGMLDD